MYRVNPDSFVGAFVDFPSGVRDEERKPTSMVASLKEFAPSIDSISAGPMGSIFADDLVIEGDIVSDGPIEIYGQVDGDVRCAFLTVAEQATVSGVLEARSVNVEGHVKGDVFGGEVELGSRAHVEGDIHHNTIAMTKGAKFDGRAYSVTLAPISDLASAA